jgi:hypothetical protein
MPHFYIYSRNHRGRTAALIELDCSNAAAAKAVAQKLLEDDPDSLGMEIWERGDFVGLIDQVGALPAASKATAIPATTPIAE